MCDVRDGTSRVYAGACEQQDDAGFLFLAGAVERRAMELFEKWKDLHAVAFSLGDNQPASGLDKDAVVGLSRTRFPWTQNWLNRSVQGGPEHDR